VTSLFSLQRTKRLSLPIAQ